MIWKEKKLLLIILGVLLAANTAFFLTYRVQYENRLRALDDRLELAKNQLEAARRTRVAAEQQLAAYRKTQRDVEQIFTMRWATENERLTAVIGEVKELARTSQLEPPSYSFTHTATTGTGGTASKKPVGATEVGISFTVQGTYQRVRRLINLLELSDQFVIIDQIALSAQAGDILTMNLHVKTLFRDTNPPLTRRGANQKL